MITGFQFNAAKATLGITAKDISIAINLHPVTLCRLGYTKNFEYLRCHSRNLIKIVKFFEKRGIVFSQLNNSISLTLSSLPYLDNNLTRFQLICARISTGLTQQELSSYLGISAGTLSILENLNNADYIKTKLLKIPLLIDFFNKVGIIFSNNTVSLMKDPETFFIKKEKC